MSISVKNGLFLGVALLIGTIAFVLASPRGFLTYSMYPLALIAILMMVKTGSDIKASQGGYAKFGELFVGILITVAIAYVLRMVGVYIAYMISPELVEIQKDISIEAVEKFSGMLDEEAMDAMYEQLDTLNPASIGTIIQQYLMYILGTGGIINAIISLIMKKDKPLIDRV